MNKIVFKTTIKQTGLRNNFLKYGCETIKRNICVSLMGKAKKECFDNLDNKVIADDKAFCETIVSFLRIKE